LKHGVIASMPVYLADQILQQTCRNGDDLAAVKSRLDRVEQRLDRVENKLDGLDMKFSAFLRDYPTAVGEIMRQVLRERHERP
jgi:hypothetical protein